MYFPLCSTNVSINCLWLRTPNWAKHNRIVFAVFLNFAKLHLLFQILLLYNLGCDIWQTVGSTEKLYNFLVLLLNVRNPYLLNIQVVLGYLYNLYCNLKTVFTRKLNNDSPIEPLKYLPTVKYSSLKPLPRWAWLFPLANLRVTE